LARRHRDRLPDDRSIAGEAKRYDIPSRSRARLVRIVEVLNLKSKDFFSARSVLAARCTALLRQPRFTVYDADFSTSSGHVNRPPR